MLSLFKVPWQLTGMVVISLEKISDGAKATPDVLTLQRGGKDKYRPTKVPPSNLASGLMRGTKSMVGQVMSAVAGVVLEPIRGAKKKGIKGATQGIGKGILGLIFKPVAGTIDLVTQTTRGIGNTPKSMMLQFQKLIKKKPKKMRRIKYTHPEIRPYIPAEKGCRRSEKYFVMREEEEFEEEEDDEIWIGEDETHDMYIDRKLLRETLNSNSHLMLDRSSSQQEEEKHARHMRSVLKKQRQIIHESRR